MRCPVCKEVSLVMTDRQGIEIDYCPQCRGVWLDRGELDKIIERSATAPVPPQAPEIPRPQQRAPEYREAPPRSSDYREAPPRTPDHRDYTPRRDYDDDDDYRDDHRRKKKRGGFLGDLFDFD